MSSIRMKEFSVFYKQKKEYLAALNKINLEISHGDFLVVIGPSGSGKSTLLKAIMGSDLSTDGYLYIDEINQEDIPTKKRNIAYVSQQFNLYGNMTVYENIAFPLKMMKAPIEEIEMRVHEIASKLGLEILLSRKPRQLSLGQQQKVAVARALIKNPQIMLFDEPFSNLDAQKRIELRKYLNSIYELYQITTIFVTHDKYDALTLAKHVAILEYGSIIYQGSKEEFLMSEKTIKYREYLYD